MAKKKNKKIYAKDRTPYISTDLEIENPMRLIIAVKGQKYANAWAEYIDKVVYQGEKTELSRMEDVKTILTYIDKKQTRDALVKVLLKIEGYNPMKDNLPLEKLPQNYVVLVKKVQQDIQYKMESIKKLNIQSKEFVLEGTRFKTAVLEFTKENFNKEIFEEGYDIIILHKEGRFLINSNPELHYSRPSLEPLYEKLSRSEPNKWYLYGNKYMLKTEREATSHFNLKQILLFMKQMQ